MRIYQYIYPLFTFMDSSFDHNISPQAWKPAIQRMNKRIPIYNNNGITTLSAQQKIDCTWQSHWSMNYSNRYLLVKSCQSRWCSNQLQLVFHTIHWQWWWQRVLAAHWRVVWQKRMAQRRDDTGQQHR